MPTYFSGSLASQLSSAGLQNPYSLNNGSGGGSGGNCCCPSSTKFLETLTDKLIEMTESIKTQIEELENRVPSCHRGLRIAEIDVPVPPIAVKQEYLIYIKRYGPPINGIFDPIYLDLIRAELAAGVL